MSLRWWPLLVFLSWIGAAKADGWDDFTNNLATDLAPLIQLFDEAVTKQFLSESMSIWDNLIFCFAPLGVLTAVVSAIRICGTSSQKAFIGRGQESAGTVELELLSSTSSTTAEVYMNGAITRVFGHPRISEYLYEGEAAASVYDELSRLEYPPDTKPIRRCRVDDFKAGRWKEIRQYGEVGAQFRRWNFVDGREFSRYNAGTPNLSLNFSIKSPPKWFLCLGAFLGFVLQAAVLVFASTTVYLRPDMFLKSGSPVPSYGFPCLAVGTILLCSGMFVCAFVVERSTVELYYKNDGKSQVWLLQFGQTVADQEVQPFIGKLDRDEYVQSSSRLMSIQPLRFLVYPAVFMSVAGFVLQFVGLRALHSSVTLFQLAITLTMSVFRAAMRTNRLKDTANLVGPPSHDFVDNVQHGRGYELDMLALRMTHTQEIQIMRPDRINPEEQNSKSELLEVRSRLAEIHEDQYGTSSYLPNSKTAQSLQCAIKDTTQFLETLYDCDGRLPLIWWKVGVKGARLFETSRARSGDPGKDHGSRILAFETYPSKVGEHLIGFQLSALVGLWSWTVQLGSPYGYKYDMTGPQQSPQGYDRLDYFLWIFKDAPIRFENDETSFRLSAPLEHRCALDIYIIFLEQALKDLSHLDGEITLRSKTDIDLPLQHSAIEALVDILERGFTLPRDEYYLIIVTLLIRLGLLPKCGEAYDTLRRKASSENDEEILEVLQRKEHG